MPPPKRTAVEAHIFEDANPISKQKLAAQAQLAGRGRRGPNTQNGHATHHTLAHTFAAQQQVNNVQSASSLKDLANISEAVRGEGGNLPTPSLDWHSEPRPLLLRYRDAFALPARTPHRNASAQYILASGIGPRSPTAARERDKRRCSRDECAGVVRKHFKDVSVPETECLVEVMYRVKMKDKAFRLKFHPKHAR